ncbi:serine/threonine-protein kinase, partial [Alienimonas chondri]|uniref:serine/threonine-protein kinase n=1 Tax=Alienimonas chondri TaxID=2681879 RepID=UPI001489F5A2
MAIPEVPANDSSRPLGGLTAVDQRSTVRGGRPGEGGSTAKPEQTSAGADSTRAGGSSSETADTRHMDFVEGAPSLRPSRSPEPPDPRELKAIVGEFSLRERIGGGAFGVVYRAWDTRLHKPVAVKLFAPDGGEAPSLVERILHEARAVSRLDHPHIVRVLRVETAPLTSALRTLLEWERDGEGPPLPAAVCTPATPEGEADRGQPLSVDQDASKLQMSGLEVGYIVSELIFGGTLQAQFARTITGTCLPDEKPAWRTPIGATRFLLPIAEAAGHAHRFGVIHRDVKPANVLLNDRGRPMLADFGIARAPHRPMGDDTIGANQRSSMPAGDADGSTTLSGNGRWLGTPAYMSPEQAAQRTGDICPATDVWALGVILWELLAGRRMHQGPGLEIIDRILRESPPPLPASVPAPAREIVAAALKENPEERPKDGSAFAALLKEAIEELEPRPALLPMNRRVALGAAAGAALAVIGVAVAISRGSDAEEIREGTALDGGPDGGPDGDAGRGGTAAGTVSTVTVAMRGAG